MEMYKDFRSTRQHTGDIKHHTGALFVSHQRIKLNKISPITSHQGANAMYWRIELSEEKVDNNSYP